MKNNRIVPRSIGLFKMDAGRLSDMPVVPLSASYFRMRYMEAMERMKNRPYRKLSMYIAAMLAAMMEAPAIDISKVVVTAARGGKESLRESKPSPPLPNNISTRVN